MGNCREGDDEDGFFDARDEVSSVSDCNSEVSEDLSCRIDQETGSIDLWTRNPESVLNRRRRFFESMGFSFKRTSTDDSEDVVLSDESTPVRSGGECHSDQSSVSSVSEIIDPDGGSNMKLVKNESKSSISDGGLHSDRSSVSCLSNSLAEALRDSFEDHVKSFEEDMEHEFLFARNESSNSGSMAGGLSSQGSSKSGSCRDLQNSPLSHRESSESSNKGRKGWLKKLSALTRVLDRHGNSSNGESRITRVQTYKKQFKELSSLHTAQEFSGHDGSILAMKFSVDGKYLATAGEDCVVRVWEIREEEKADGLKVRESDSSSCVYFRINESSVIEPVKAESEKMEKKTRLLNKSDMTCTVLPPRVFGISETPLHEFKEHKGEILGLSWSAHGLLVSCSVDGTVRLWRVGCEECVKVFSHKNFVTCVAFNPADDNYFISGSIDGKVRLWNVSRCRVVDYTDVRDIVTALCFHPHSKGVVVGTMSGDCRFYNIIDEEELELEREVKLNGKKKVGSKRITGIQYMQVAGDADKVMVTTADSQIRLLTRDGDLIAKLKGSSLLTSLSPTSASFTSDGKHVVSTTEGSGIHVWNLSRPSKSSSSSSASSPISIRACESFVSHNTSIAVPWPVPGSNKNNFAGFISDVDNRLPHLPSRDCFCQTRGGSTTWPEEKLPGSGAVTHGTSSSRSKVKLLRSACQNASTSSGHLWGLVVVAATWDGKIRTFLNYGLPIRV